MRERTHSRFGYDKRGLIKVIIIQLAITTGIFGIGNSAHAGGGYLAGRWYPYCENGYNSNGLGGYSFCLNGSNYRIQYASGDWVQSYCGANVVYRSRSLSESQAAWFHGQVCGIPSGGGGTNMNDVMVEMMRMMGQQYQY